MRATDGQGSGENHTFLHDGESVCSVLNTHQQKPAARLVPAMNLQDTMQAALQEYGRNTRYPHPEGMVEDPDGELVRLWDEDAGF